jgi:hypothetical protein
VVFFSVRGWGAPQAAAGAFAVGFHLAGFIPVTVIGLYYAWRMGLTFGEVRSSEEVVEDAVETTRPPSRKNEDDGTN